MADPRTILARAIISDTYYNGYTGVGVYAFSLEIVDGQTGEPIKDADFSSIYTESLVEAGVIVYPSIMGYIMTAGQNDDYSDVILSIIDHSDSDTVYSAYFDNMSVLSGAPLTFTEGDTPPDPSDDGGGD